MRRNERAQPRAFGRSGPLHIALVSRSVVAHSPGGMETHGEALRRWLTEAGHTVTTLTTALPDGPGETRDEWGVTRYLAGSAPGAYSRAWGVSLVASLLALHDGDGVDVIASQSAAAFSYLAQRRHIYARQRIPTALMNHGTIVSALPEHLRGIWRRPLYTLARQAPRDLSSVWHDRRMYPLADAITTLTTADKAAICRWLSVSPDRVTVIANGVDTALFRPSGAERQRTRARLGITDDEVAVAISARLEPRKGQQVMLRALAHPALRSELARIRLLLIGDGPARESLRAQAKRLGLAERLLFLGQTPHDRLPALLNAADIVAAPSLNDIMPLALLEAMACGRAVVASRVGAMGDMITHGANGLLVPPAEPAALSQAIAALASDPERATRLGAQARADVAANYDIAHTMRAYEDALARAAARRVG